MIERTQRVAAKVYAIACLLSLAVIMYVFPHAYAPYLVLGSGETTARNLVSHGQTLGLYLTGAFLHGLGILVLLVAFYLILRPVSRGLAAFAATSKLLYAVFWFVSLLQTFGAMRLLRGAGSLHGFGPDALAALAGAQLDSSWDAYYIALVLNALGTAIFAWVFFRSRYVPRALALWGVAAALFEGICGFAYLIAPAFAQIVSPDWYEMPHLLFDVGMCGWLLIRGLKSPENTAANR
jgi:hypothetical protein